MKHGELKQGTLRAYLDGEIDSGQAVAVDQHLRSCTVCQGELATLRDNAALCARAASIGCRSCPRQITQRRPGPRFRRRGRIGWIRSRIGGPWGGDCPSPVRGLGVAAVILVLTVAPVRAWAESLLAIFRVERFTILEIDPSALKSNGLTKQPVAQSDDQPRSLR